MFLLLLKCPCGSLNVSIIGSISYLICRCAMCDVRVCARYTRSLSLPHKTVWEMTNQTKTVSSLQIAFDGSDGCVV